MTTEWTINTPKKEVRPASKKEWAKKIDWEKKKIEDYNAQFPLLPGGKDTMSDAQKIAYIDNQRAIKREADHKAYLEREARRQAKAERKARAAQLAEQEHVQYMIAKWGAHRWYWKVMDTYDDCVTAERIRFAEEKRRFEEEELERERLEKQQIQKEIQKQKYISEHTAHMSEEEKQNFIREYEYEEAVESDYEYQCMAEDWYRECMATEQEDRRRLEAYNKKNLV